MAEPYIEDIIEEAVDKTSEKVLSIIQANETAALGSTLIQGIRYSKSSFDELIETLAQADGSPEENKTKYPLVHLVQDLFIKRGEDVGVFGSGDFNLVIIHQTDLNYKIEDRDVKVFKPVLWPIYFELLRQLHKSKWIFGSDVATGEFKHTLIKRAFWGTRQLEGAKNKLNDYVDALEIRNLNLKYYSNC